MVKQYVLKRFIGGVSMSIVKKIGKVKLAISIILLVGVVIYGVMLYDAYNKISVGDVKVVDLHPTSLDLRTWEIKFRIYINNTADMNVEVTKITYKVYINGTYIGEGEKTSLVIEAHTNKYYQFSLEFDAVQLGITTLLTSKGTKEVKVNGKVTIPLKPFNLFTLQQVSFDYEKITYYQ